MKNTPGLSSGQYESMLEEIESLKKELQKNTEDYEFKIMKLENVIDSLKIVKSTRINAKGEVEEEKYNGSLLNKQEFGP